MIRFLGIHTKEGALKFLNFSMVSVIEPLPKADFPAASRLYFVGVGREPLDVRETAQELRAALHPEVPNGWQTR